METQKKRTKKRSKEVKLDPIAVALQNQPKVTATHGLGTRAFGEDGILRQVDIGKFDNGLYTITLATFWEGPGKAPCTTPLTLSKSAYELLLSGMLSLHTRMDDFRINRLPGQPK